MMIVMPATVPAFVYRAYDESDELIYIGSTKNVATRVGQHQSVTTWWTTEVARIEVDIYPTIEQARAEERKMIETTAPRRNITYSKINRPTRARDRQEAEIINPDAYALSVTREDGWWMIRVPELDLLTQAKAWSEVETMGQGVIASHLDVPPDEITVRAIATPNDDVLRLLASAKNLETRAKQLKAESHAARQAAVRRLHAQGRSYRAIAKMMGLTHQRIEQLVKGNR